MTSENSISARDIRGRRTGLLQIHFAVVLAGAVGLIARVLDLSPVALTAGRTAFAAGALLITALIVRTPLRTPKKRDMAVLALSGIFLAIHWSCFFQAIAVSSIAIALVATASFPLFMTFLEPLCFHERLRKTDIAMGVMTCAGLVLVAPAFDISNHMTQGLLWGVAAAIAYTPITLINRSYGNQPAIRVTFYQQTTAALITLPFAFGALASTTWMQIGGLAILGLIFTALAQGLVAASQRFIRGQTVGVLYGLEPVYGILLAWLLLNEAPGWRTLMGGVLVCGSSAWASFIRR